ncbi:MAG: carboxypeptidase regulatory-like domain-containing protein [Armatimonadota bacterium]
MLHNQVRMVLIGLSVLIMVACAPAFSAMPGDANSDGKIAVNDALLTLRISIGLVPPTPEQQLVCDVSPLEGSGGRPMGDGRIAVADALLILRAAIGLIQLPAEMPTTSQAREPALLPKSEVVDIQQITNKDFVLPDGFWVSGTVTDSTGRPVTGGTVTFILGPDLTETRTAAISASGAYKAALASGSHKVTIKFPLQTPAGAKVEFRVPEPLMVSQDMKKDFAVPPLPQFFTVRGTVRMSNSGFVPLEVSFEQTDERWLTVSSTAAVVNQGFTTSLPVGIYRVNVSASSGELPFVIPGDTGDDIQVGGGGDEVPPGLPGLPGLPPIPELPTLPSIPGLFSIGDSGYRTMQFLFADVLVNLPSVLAVAGDTTANLVVPKVYKLSGSVQYSDGTIPQYGMAIIAVESGNVSEPSVSLGLGSGMVMMGKYKLWLQAGVYEIQASQVPETSGVAVQAISLVRERYKVAGDQTLDVSVAKLSAFDGKLTGKVLDPTGKPVANAHITASAYKPPTGSGLTAVSAFVTSSADGSYTILAPQGTYTVIVLPPEADSENNGG